jgi:hypothetical protein
METVPGPVMETVPRPSDGKRTDRHDSPVMETVPLSRVSRGTPDLRLVADNTTTRPDEEAA